MRGRGCGGVADGGEARKPFGGGEGRGEWGPFVGPSRPAAASSRAVNGRDFLAPKQSLRDVRHVIPNRFDFRGQGVDSPAGTRARTRRSLPADAKGLRRRSHVHVAGVSPPVTEAPASVAAPPGTTVYCCSPCAHGARERLLVSLVVAAAGGGVLVAVKRLFGRPRR